MMWWYLLKAGNITLYSKTPKVELSKKLGKKKIS